MRILNSNETLNELYFLKAIGYKFINTSFSNFKKISNFDSIYELNKQIKECSLCALKKTAKHSLVGSGNKNAKIMFITLSPSVSEDESGEFLQGNLGLKLRELIFNALNLEKDEFYISSILRCKSLADNSKNLECFNLCKPYIIDEIRLINPHVIVALGEQVFLNLYPQNSMSMNFESIRGSILKFRDSFLLPTYSNSWLMKNPSFESIFLDDLRKIKGLI
ncbi:uracil-DNA glycosylase [Campylobacter sp. faydin G-24]|uniref:Uracil-DNA glycosylase n=1 Tax=Campylobacter anatolicus TaxID=2829105 RepID=A0ABS5HIR1_9BACT|nr:uracil-DNA glycosylase [Campylobacter anatolicus]MBR8464151.1 uracil-DNA glycosylase [Campylobacter anatolicus]